MSNSSKVEIEFRTEAQIYGIIYNFSKLPQLGNCARLQKREAEDEEVPITTESVFDTLKRGFERTFTQEKLNVSLCP